MTKDLNVAQAPRSMIEMSRVPPLRQLAGLLHWSLRYTERQNPTWRTAAFYVGYASPLLFF